MGKSYIFPSDPKLNVITWEFIHYNSPFLLNNVFEMAIKNIIYNEFNSNFYQEISEIILKSQVLSMTENTLDEIVESALELANHLYSKYKILFIDAFNKTINYVERVFLIPQGIVITVDEGLPLIKI